MRIVIDMQAAQTESRFRGIGRYTMSLTEAIVRNRGEHEIILALNGLFPDAIELIRVSFDDVLPQKNIRVWYAPGPVKECEPGNEWQREVAELIREAFLAGLLPDVVLVPSLFEGYIDDAVTSIGVFAQCLPTAVILYDLIPLLNPEIYLTPNPVYQQCYLRKIDSFKKADSWLAISESAAKEGREALGLDQDCVVNISTASDALFRPLGISAETQHTLLKGYDIRRPFILYSGGADDRKNLARIIQAYAQLPATLRQNHQLVLAGKMPQANVECFKQEATSAGLCAGELIITGYVSDDALVQLYNLCKVFLFPSLHEGFGLPALEAMACGAPVIGSNTSSVPEVIGRNDALFDPQDVGAIRDKMIQVLEDDTFRTELSLSGLKQAKKFSWDDTARRAVVALEQMLEEAFKVIAPNFGVEEIIQRLVNAVANVASFRELSDADCAGISASIARNHPDPCRKRRIYIDVSELIQRDAGTGIQRVTRAILRELLVNRPAEFDVHAVYSPAGSQYYMQANMFMGRMFAEVTDEDCDFVIDPQCGDIFVGLDLQPQIVSECRDYYRLLRQQGVQVFFVVYDLLPIILPAAFPRSASDSHTKWLEVVAEGNGAICISKAVADDLRTWLGSRAQSSPHSFALRWFHLGADIENSGPTSGLPLDANEVLDLIRSRPTFLMVGTVEPRKGHKQALAAFESLWSQGSDVGLVIVGKCGWAVEQFVDSLGDHLELGNRLFWLEGISDEFLAKVYEASTCLLAASEGEGFGLPLIEAAQHEVPIIARELSVFREVAGESAFYFSGTAPEILASSIKEWLSLYAEGRAPSSAGIRWLTWTESADQFIKAILGKKDKSRKHETNIKGVKIVKPFDVGISDARSPTVLLLSPYPIRLPRHGGQLRTAAIRKAFEATGFKVQAIGFYQTEAYGAADLDKSDIAFPPDSPYRIYRRNHLPSLSDFLMASFSVLDDCAFQQVAKSIDSDIDVIVVEQPWFHKLAKRLQREVPQCRNALILFSSQNIEAPMKQQILGTSVRSAIVDAAVADISELERTAALESNLTVAVTAEDADILRSYGASNLLVAPNGINPWSANSQRIDFWRAKLPKQPWPIFIASAHPPNYTEFIAAVGDALGCIPPGSKLVVAGGVGPHLMKELSISPWGLLNVARIQVLGVLDDADLSAVKSLAHAFLLPIGAGGGSNIKTAEALYSGKPVVCTNTSLRGFEAYRSLPGVRVADTPKEFQSAIRSILGTESREIPELEIHRSLRQQLTWADSLHALPQEVTRMLSEGDNIR